MSAADRVKVAAEATAASVREIRPLTLPGDRPAPAEPHERRGRRARWVSLRWFEATWMTPLGAAALVVTLALALVNLRHPQLTSPAPTQSGGAAPAVTGIPRYYAVATEGRVSHNGEAAINVTVADVYTGKTLATVALPAIGVTPGMNAAIGVSAAADDRSFMVGRRDGWGDVDYFLVRIAPGAKQVATVKRLPIPTTSPGVLLGFAVSPDGKELAALSVRGNGTTLRIYSITSGAALRTWIAGPWQYPGDGVQQAGVSWTADGSQVAFATVIGGNTHGVLQERLISAAAPSGDLATASKVVLGAPGNCTSLLLTPDGGTVVCATLINYPRFSSGRFQPGSPGDCGKDGPAFVTFSAVTGQRLRVLYPPAGACDYGIDTVLWSDNSARHVVGEQELFQQDPPQSTDRYGVATAGVFIKFQVAQHGQWYSGPAF